MFRSSRVSSCGHKAWLSHHKGSLALTHTAKAGARCEKGDGGEAAPGRENPSEQHTYVLDPSQMQTQACPPVAAQRRPTTACVLPWGPWRQPLHPVPFKAVQGQPLCSLPPFDDSDDIIHLDVQLVWFLKVLKGPHVGGLGLRVETGHSPLWG